MEINISEINKKKIEKLDRDKKLDEYEQFYKKDTYKISLINVDSAFRDINPKNISMSLPNSSMCDTDI
jgi:hypothetical protein